MRILSIVGLGAFMIVSLIVGLRLLRLAARTRQVPEASLGTALLASGFLGYGLWVGATALPQLPDSVARGAFLAGVTGQYVGAAAVLAFTWRVFRPGAIGATLFGVGAAWLAAGFAGDVLTGEAAHYTAAFIENPWFYVGLAGRTAAPGWMAAESLHYHGLLRRRLRLGLAEPHVVRRVLWWGVAGVATALAFGVTLWHRLHYGTGLAAHPWVTNLVSALALLAAFAMWITFFPSTGRGAAEGGSADV